mgnify:CR=1 FL=1
MARTSRVSVVMTPRTTELITARLASDQTMPATQAAIAINPKYVYPPGPP